MLDRLFALETFGIKLGLENISRLCAGLGNPERSFVSLHIAGTNGKGSVAAMMHAALLAAGVRAGRYTSPHLSSLTERFVIGDRAVDPAVLEAAVGRVLDCAERLQASGELRVPPTFFEAATATAFELFRDAGVEVAVIEVGLGGRFDATNVIAPKVGVITTIGFDHQQHLGETIGEIAFEKAGIIKPGMTVVAGQMPREAHEVVHRVAAERNATIIDANDDVTLTVAMEDGAARITLTTPSGEYGPVTLGLRGAHQVGNAVVAVRALEAAAAQGIPLTPSAIADGLAHPDWPGRLELVTVSDGGRLLIDAAHNVDGATALAAHLRQWHPERPPLVFGVMHDKDVDAMLQALLPTVSSVIATAARTTRALPPEELARHARRVADDLGLQIPVTVCADPDDAVRLALERAPMACVAGSIFLAGAVRDGLRQRTLPR